MRYAVLAVTALLIAACSGGRSEPGGSFADPLCMPDGTVVFYEYPSKSGQYDEVTATKANCPWNKGRS
jgi:hypothetical protein